MANDTKILVTHGGSPLVGATVLVGELLGQAKETDEDGKIAFDLDPGFIGVVNILVTKSPDVQATALLELVRNEEHTIAIPIP